MILARARVHYIGDGNKMARTMGERMAEIAQNQGLQGLARLVTILGVPVVLGMLMWGGGTLLGLDREAATKRVQIAQLQKDVAEIHAARQRDSDAAGNHRTELAELKAEVRGLRNDMARLIGLFDGQRYPPERR